MHLKCMFGVNTGVSVSYKVSFQGLEVKVSSSQLDFVLKVLM